MLFEESEFEKLTKKDIYELLKYYSTNQLVSWLNCKVLCKTISWLYEINTAGVNPRKKAGSNPDPNTYSPS